MSALFDLVTNEQWQVAITHILSLADCDAVDQLFFQSSTGLTPIMSACCSSAPLELYQVMITKAKLDSRKRSLLAITNSRATALHFAACHRDSAVVELLIREHPLALSATDSRGRTSQQYATLNNSPAAITSLLTDTTNALAARDYTTLAALVHGSAFALRCLASPSYAARIAVRPSRTCTPTCPSPPRNI